MIDLETIRASADQIGVGLFGVAAIFLSQHADARVRRFACICGLCAQPFWFWTTASHGQWAIFALSFFYTYSWWTGFRNFWLEPWRANRKAGEPPLEPERYEPAGVIRDPSGNVTHHLYRASYHRLSVPVRPSRERSFGGAMEDASDGDGE